MFTATTASPRDSEGRHVGGTGVPEVGDPESPPAVTVVEGGATACGAVHGGRGGAGRGRSSDVSGCPGGLAGPVSGQAGGGGAGGTGCAVEASLGTVAGAGGGVVGTAGGTGLRDDPGERGGRMAGGVGVTGTTSITCGTGDGTGSGVPVMPTGGSGTGSPCAGSPARHRPHTHPRIIVRIQPFTHE